MTHSSDSVADSPVDEGASPAPRASRGVRIFLRDILIIFVAAILISVGIKAFLIRSFYIPSASMEDTLEINDRIIVNELVPKLVAVKHGDVVVFKDPGGWLPPVTSTPAQNPVVSAVDWVLSVVGLSAPDSDDHLVKRVIGLPGDTVACCDAQGRITVNGVAIREPYLKLAPGVTRVSSTDFSVTVPKGELWVMGDNRYNSEDSRAHVDGPTHGFVPMDDVVGRAFVITWPSSRWTWLGDYPDVFARVDDADK